MRLQLIQFPMNAEALSMDTARILLRTTRDLYLCASDDEGAETEGDDAGRSCVDMDNTCSLEGPMNPTPGARADVDDVMVRGGIDLILEFLCAAWEQVRESLSSVLRPDATALATALKVFLEAAVHGAGTLRYYATKETNRKRLRHMGVIRVISDGIRTAIKVSAERELCILISCSLLRLYYM